MTAAYALATGVHLFAFALVVGFMAITLWALIPAQHLLDGSGYAVLEARMNRVLQPLIPVLFVLVLLGGAGATVIGFLLGRPTVWWQLAATLGALVMVVSTLIINHPVNNAINDWDPERLPPDWAAQRSRWELGHRIRVTVGLPALACSILAVTLPLV